MRACCSLPVSVVIAMCGFVPLVAVAADPPAALAKRAQAILKEHCYECHGEGGAAEGGVNYVLEVPRLISRGKLVAGNAVKSKLYTQVKTGNMPKDAEPLGKADIETLGQWIDAGAPDFNPPAAQREFISPAKMFEFVKADLETIDSRKRPLIRYFTLTHLYNAGLSDDELATYRNGVVKLINSLSWAPDIVVPKAIDPAKTIFRLDIGDIEWSAATWDRILAENPYGVTYDTAAATACYKHCTTTQPFVRGDWFVARASIPPLYHDILELPRTDLELEKKLQVDVKRNLQTDRAARAGFNGSGVSRNNRLIERHRSNLTRGAYWKSYDFGGNDGTKNLFANPAGRNGQDTFAADGGELIFSLPNGLQGYMLIDGKGERIDKGPINVVSDPKRPDKAVVNGLSCMSCHARGMIEKTDQVRPAVLGNPNGYTAEVLASVKALYPPEDVFAKLLAQDKDRFAKAVEATGAALGETEPIVTLALRFEEVLDLPLAAAEAGVSSTELVQGLGRSPALARILGALKVPGGTVQREVYLANFALIVHDLKLGTYVGKGVIPPPTLPTPTRPTPTPTTPTPPVRPTNGAKLITSASTGMKLTLIPAGTFLMGSSAADVRAALQADSTLIEVFLKREQPQHSVRITQPFYMGVYEVTQGEYESVMGATPSYFSKTGSGKSDVSGLDTSKFPVESVSWFDAIEFCNKLSVKDGLTPYYSLATVTRESGSIKSATVTTTSGNGYRLPTEAQWEYACRGNTTTPFHFGSVLNGDKANIDGNFPFGTATKGKYLKRTTTVGSYAANAFGLNDMHGNVGEWCFDVFDETAYGSRSGTTSDPAVTSGSEYRVLSGGSWGSFAGLTRAAIRERNSPGNRVYSNGGFRVVCVGVRTP